MSNRVLLSLENNALAADVSPMLQLAGYRVSIVSDPSELPARGVDAEVVAVVAQNRYQNGKRCDDILGQLRAARSQSLPAVLICERALSEDERTPLVREHDVRAFLTSNAPAAAVVEAVRIATRDNGVHEAEAAEAASDPFDLVLELQDVLDDADADPHREITKAVEIDVPREARAENLDEPTPTTHAANISTLATETTSIDFDLRTLGLQAKGQATGADVSDEGQEDMTQIEELKKQLSQERKSREKAELERDRQQRIAKERAESEKRMRDRAQQAEASLKEASEDKSKTPTPEDHRLERFESEAQQLKRQRLQLERRIKKLEADLLEAQGAPALLDGSMFDDDDNELPTEGRFEQVPYPRILGKLLHSGFSGSLSLRSGSVQREIFFSDGKPVAHATAAPGEQLGRILVEEGRISEEQYLAAARRMVERGVRLTEALLELGYIDTERLIEEQRYLTRDQIVSGFGMIEGSFVLSAGSTPATEASRFEFSPGEIYVAGYRQYAPEGEVKALYETIRGVYLIDTEELNGYRPQLGLEAEDERLLRLLGKAYTVDEAVVRAQVTEDRAARLLGALRALGLVRAWVPKATHFEERLRSMEQEQREHIAELREHLHQREERLLDAFEKALERLDSSGGAQGLQLKLGDDAKATHVETILPSTPTSKRADKKEAQTTERREAVSPRLAIAPATQSTAPVSPMPKPRSEEKASMGTSTGAGPAHQSIEKSTEKSIEKNVENKSSLDFAFIPPADKQEAAVMDLASHDFAAATADPKEGIIELTVADSIAPAGPGDDKYRLGLQLAASNQLDEAEAVLREAVRMDAQQPLYLAALAKVLLNNPKYDRMGTIPVVRSLLERAQILAPDDTDISDLLTRVSEEPGQ